MWWTALLIPGGLAVCLVALGLASRSVVMRSALFALAVFTLPAWAMMVVSFAPLSPSEGIPLDPAPVAMVPAEHLAGHEGAWAWLYHYEPNVYRWRPYIEDAAARNRIPPEAIAAVMVNESHGRMEARGAAGEVCAMQIVPYEMRHRFEWAASRPTSAWLVQPENCISWAASHLASKKAVSGGEGWWGAFRRYNGICPQACGYAEKVNRTYATLVQASAVYAGSEQPRDAQRTGVWTWPSSGRVCGSFGGVRAWQPNGHTGLDICQGWGSTIVAAADGTVTYVGEFFNGGRVTVASPGSPCAYEAYRGPYAIRIQHAGGYETTYSHNVRALVVPGQRVQAGQPIAQEGNRGCVVLGQSGGRWIKANSLAALGARGTHLHFEVLYKGQFIDPARVLPRR